MKNMYEAARAYLAADEKITKISQRAVAMAGIPSAGVLCLEGLWPMARAIYYARQLDAGLEARPELVSPELRGELITAHEKASAVLGLPVGDQKLMEELYE